jgi:hypothetical protein
LRRILFIFKAQKDLRALPKLVFRYTEKRRQGKRDVSKNLFAID